MIVTVITYLQILYETFLREKSSVQDHYAILMCVRLPLFQLDNQLTGFHEIWYDHYAIGGHLNLIQSVIMWQTYKLVR
jgi:hypothetical protein